MSQLDNENKEINTDKLINEIEQLEDMPKEENKEKKVKKKFWTIKKVIIFLIIFAIIAMGITAGLIYMENIKPQKQNNTEILQQEEKEKIEPDNLGVKSFKDKYFINELEIKEEIIYTEGNGEIDEFGDSTHPIYVKVQLISGLKDKVLENRINEEIKSTAINWISRRR